MNIPEAIVSRVSFNKFGELFIQFKVKKEDQTSEMRSHFMSLWESGNSLALATAPFQSEEGNSEKTLQTPLKSKPESIYAKVAEWFRLNKGVAEYEKWKRDLFFKHRKISTSEIVHLRDFLTEEMVKQEFEDYKNSL
jgi:hypothetical protein